MYQKKLNNLFGVLNCTLKFVLLLGPTPTIYEPLCLCFRTTLQCCLFQLIFTEIL